MNTEKSKTLSFYVDEYRQLTDFENILFALPFTIGGMLLANKNSFPSLKLTLLVLVIFFMGWVGALVANKLIDSDIDAKNPRTSDRSIPAGRISKKHAFWIILVSFSIMTIAIAQLPIICLKLLPLALVALIIYPFTKRFTAMCHIILGCALGAGAAGGWIAMTGAITLPIIFWGLASAFWVAGFDVIYGTLDIDFDRKNNIHSIPAKYGLEKSLIISKVLHLLSLLCFLAVALVHDVSFMYYLAVVFVAVMLGYEHHIAKDKSRIGEAFFSANAIIGAGIFLFIIIGKFL